MEYEREGKEGSKNCGRTRGRGKRRKIKEEGEGVEDKNEKEKGKQRSRLRRGDFIARGGGREEGEIGEQRRVKETKVK